MLLGFGIFTFLLIVFLTGVKDAKWNSIALGGLMVFFWIFEVIPIYVTALFPFIIAVPLGIMTTEDLASAYGDSNVYLFLGGFILALGLEKWNVHEQVARGIIHVVGKSKTRIILGFILSTGFLSMWISNTATALMMLPMASAIIHTLPDSAKKGKFPLFLMLSVAYGASIGGMATLVGSPPNIQMAGILAKEYGIKVDFLEWFKIGFPIAIIMLLAVFTFFYLLMGKERKEKNTDFQLHKTPWTKDQKRVVLIFSMVVFFWIFKELFKTYLGWSYRDENVAILGGVLMFIIPSSESKPLLNWKDTEKLPWGILLLFGGGLALAAMFKKNGVIDEITNVFLGFTNYPIFFIILSIVIIAIFATEIMSNLALVTLFVPIIAQFALKSDYSIVQLCVPLTLAASCAFMLPVGTPPNAIVFSSGIVKIRQMVSVGFVLNIIGVLVVTLLTLLILH